MGRAEYPRPVPLPSRIVLADGRTATIPPGSRPASPSAIPTGGGPPGGACSRSATGCASSTGSRSTSRTAIRSPSSSAGVLSQNTNDHNRDVAYSRLRERFPDLGGGPRRADRGGRGGDQAGRTEPDQGAPHPGDPRPLGDHPDLDWLAEAPRDEALAFLDRPAGRGTEDRRRGPALHLRPTGDPGRRARQAGRRATRPVQGRCAPSRRPTTRCSRSPHPRTPTSSTST